MPVYRSLHTAFRLVWAGARPGQPTNACAVICRIIFYGICMSASSPGLSLSLVLPSHIFTDKCCNNTDNESSLCSLTQVCAYHFPDIRILSLYRSDYEKTTCVLENYQNYTVAMPYQESLRFMNTVSICFISNSIDLSQGSCAHVFQVNFTVNSNSKTGIIPDLTFPFLTLFFLLILYPLAFRYGVCSLTAKNHARWRPKSTSGESHSCYYNKDDLSLLMLELPSAELFSNLVIIIIILILPAILYIFSLIFIVFWLIRCCFPSFGGPLEDQEVPLDALDNDAALPEAHLAQLQELLQGNNNNNNNNNNNGGDGGNQAGNGNNNGNNGNDDDDGLTPAQRQMRNQGWFN